MAETIEKTAAQEILENAEALKSWMNSVVDNQKDAAFYGNYGVERAAKDALDCSFRIAASVCHALEQIAVALDRLEAERETNIV